MKTTVKFLKGIGSVVGVVAVVAVFAGGSYILRHPPQAIATLVAPAGYTEDVPSPSPSPTNDYDTVVGSATAPSPDPTPTAAPTQAPSGPVTLPAPGADAAASPPPSHPALPDNTSVWIGQGTYTVEAGQPVTLTAKLQNGWPGVAVEYVWGDDLAGKTGDTVTVTFATPGTYHATVTAYQVYSGFKYQVPSTGPATQIVVTAPPQAASASPSPSSSSSPSPG